MIFSLEKRIYKALDSKLEKLVPPTAQSQHLLESTISRCLQDLDKKIGDSIGRQLKDMQAAIIKGVIDAIGATNAIPATVTEPTEPPLYDFTTPSEAADCRINDVLRDLNVASDASDASLPATTAGAPAPLDHEGPIADDSAPMDLSEHQVKEQERILGAVPVSLHQGPNDDDSSPMEEQLDEEEVVANLNTEQVRMGGPHGDDPHPQAKQIHEHVDDSTPMDEEHLSPPNAIAILKEHNEGNVIETCLTAQQNKQAADFDPTVNQEAVSEEVDIDEQNQQAADVDPTANQEAVSEEVDMDEMQIPFYLFDMPSFSLGLSQEDAPVSKGHEEEALEQRKSKRAKVAPVVLQDYKCDGVTAGLSIIPDLAKRFELMEQRLLNESIVILNSGYSVTPAEFCDIGHRKNILSCGVMDALIGVVSRAFLPPDFSFRTLVNDISLITLICSC
ncbi:unnamed protein product [Eruca vesicaria subsp. sativa]|uniref:Uncharacterized protein n=1 Tax=Eruca vesicaria subsp. sativa TaxID=29727 RepID=A0ABC8JVF6_ERUVS|nr:unnamed protein product [Eruca vesicaria subsp. sativa]